jgi:AMP deaminase
LLNAFRLFFEFLKTGPTHHLATSYLLAESINHGWRLDKEPAAQYLYYCSQIGLGLCPLSNDALFVSMNASPIGKLHQRGLRVCLGTDDPLQFHNTNTPLLEEYTVAGHFFEFTTTDKSEIARNSVLVSTIC